jgi:hypothetical protein
MVAAKHQLEIEISPDGQIHVHVKGAKGKRCLEYVELFKSIGLIRDQQATSEMHEPEVGIVTQEETKTRIRER